MTNVAFVDVAGDHRLGHRRRHPRQRRHLLRLRSQSSYRGPHKLLCKDSFMPVKYHKCDDGRIIFGKGWSDFVDSEESRFIKTFFSVSRPPPVKIFRSRWL